MNIILSTLSMLGLLIISSGLYIFHNIFMEIMPFSFKTKLKEYCFFFFAYLGLCVFTISWGILYYLFYLYFDFIFSLNFSSCVFALIFMLFFLLSFGLFFIDAINYQFMLESYWEKENQLLFVISRISGVFFFISSTLLDLKLFYISFSSLFTCYFYSAFMIILSFIYFFWLIVFFYNFFFKKSIFLV